LVIVADEQLDSVSCARDGLEGAWTEYFGELRVDALFFVVWDGKSDDGASVALRADLQV
jgi:hypothetical protein